MTDKNDTEVKDFDSKINEIIAKTCPGPIKVYCDNEKTYNLKDYKYPLEKYVREQYYNYNQSVYIGRCYVYPVDKSYNSSPISNSTTLLRKRDNTLGGDK
ncbi:MAG: hypothetical protein Faunusvirus13_20 [Faunusvirus sp.]|jgi:hypothetical protein|uniref:Uncharacterized protein n=1 Tax=Faunusvirus sp. TaxID=2487766 RepID=A0A3G4ZWZ7_9VIRU|nr:MAG: hypothetical protein Faunusvirus13_20 [Faunusvirus sp.]